MYFQLDRDFINADDFLIGDIRVEGQRHLMFSTPFQQRLLKQAKRWFIDGTFKVCRNNIEIHV